MNARRKQFRGKFRSLLVSLVVWATATPSGYAQAWKYHPKKSWEYHPKTSWEYHPKKSWEYHPKTSWEYHPKTSWEYHPKQKQQLLLRRDTEKNDYRITCTQPLIAELVAQVTSDRVQVESFDIDFIFLTQVFYDVIRCPVPSRAPAPAPVPAQSAIGIVPPSRSHDLVPPLVALSSGTESRT
jgi:hypothetical protein